MPAGRLSEEDIARVRDGVDIVEWIGSRVRLERSGKRYKGLCPFHQEKTPSFHVDPEKRLYHCFGCHAGGDVISFTMQLEGLGFLDAVRRLAEHAGIELHVDAPSPEAKRRRRLAEAVQAANAAAAEWFAACLQSSIGERARAYLSTRGISGESISRFRLGYAPAAADLLVQALARRDVAVEAAVAAGLLGRREDGSVYSRFRHRLIFPIDDGGGRVIGFGGRALEDGQQPKYLNSPESPLFSKRRVLFGVGTAGTAIRREERVLVVEGYMDVLALHQAGFEWTVGSLGTAFTADQARALRRLTGRVWLAFDADTAGQAASLRSLDVLTEAGLEVAVVVLPEGDDPDSFVRRRGPQAWRDLINEALPLPEYRLRQALKAIDVGSVEGRARGVRAVLPILAAMTSPVLREGYLERAAAQLGVSVEALREELALWVERPGRRAGRRTSAPAEVRGVVRSAARHSFGTGRYTNRDLRVGGGRRASAPAPTRELAEALAERAVLQEVLDEPALAPVVVAALGPEPFGTIAYNQLLQALLSAPDRGIPAQPELARLAAALSAERRVGSSFQSALARLWALARRRSLARLAASLDDARHLPPAERVERLAGLMIDFHRLCRRRPPAGVGAAREPR